MPPSDTIAGAMEIRHDAERQRFVTEVDGHEGVLDYRRRADGTLDYRHTFVPPALRGRGVGAHLVLAALDHARAQGVKIVPTCPFVERVIAEHPEYRDLVAS